MDGIMCKYLVTHLKYLVRDLYPLFKVQVDVYPPS